jgi:hypothetical protein
MPALVVTVMGAWAGCASEQGGLRGQGTEQIAIAPVPEALIQMRRSGCVGAPCPIYGVSIFLDGTVVYDGHANVRVPGERRWKISPQRVNQLLKEIDAMGFLDTPERSGICPDSTRTAIVILDYRPGASQKTVIHDARCALAPPALSALEEAIDRMTEAGRWVVLPAPS